MNRLILSEDATVELDGKKVTLKEGDTVQVDKNTSLFKVDNEFEISTEKGRMLVEPGDQIQVGGEYKALSSSEFTSDGKKFVIEKGDDFGVVEPKASTTPITPATPSSASTLTEDIVEEGVWDEVKRGFLGKDTAAEAVSKILGQLLKLGRLIVAKAERAKAEGKHPYDQLLASKEMATLNELFKLNKEGLGGESLSVGEVVDILDLEDPTELISKVRDELVRIGDNRLARRVEEMIPKGIFGKINQVWKNITGGKMAKGELSTRAKKQGRDAPSDLGLGQAMSAAKARLDPESGKPVKPDKPDPIRLKKIWDYIKDLGVVNVEKIIDHFGGKVDGEEIKQAVMMGQEKKPESVPEKIDNAVEEVVGEDPNLARAKKVWAIMKPMIESGQIDLAGGKILRKETEFIRSKLEEQGEKLTRSDLKKAYSWGKENDPISPPKKAPSPKKDQPTKKAEFLK